MTDIKEAHGLEVVAWQDAENPQYTTGEKRQMQGWATDGYPIVPLCSLPKAQAVIDKQAARIAELQKDADRYRWLRKVTPYRFKKIQDASVTDGGDVLYFHADRFDAAIDAAMGSKGDEVSNRMLRNAL